MLCRLIAVTLAIYANSFSYPDSYRAVLRNTKPDCITETSIAQTFFAQLNFIRLDTGCSESFNPVPGYRPIRIAVDSSGRIFQLFGSDSSQFNEMLRTHPVTIGIDNAFRFGQLYIDIALLFDPYGYQYVSSSEDLLKLNREDVEMWIDPNVFKKMSRAIDSATVDLCKRLNFRLLEYDRIDECFMVDYYVWYDDSGDLRHVRLSISRQGVCFVKEDEVVATKIGYYDPIHR